MYNRTETREGATAMTQTATIAAIKALSPKLTVRHSDGEYRVSFNVEAILNNGHCASYKVARDLNEDMAYYTNDADDAVMTAKDMLRRFNARYGVNLY